MARLTTESERVTACCESRQQLQTQVSDRIAPFSSTEVVVRGKR
jgi:hypothetical protein